MIRVTVCVGPDCCEKEKNRFTRRLAHYLRRLGAQKNEVEFADAGALCVWLGGPPPSGVRIICASERADAPDGALRCGLAAGDALSFSGMGRGNFSICYGGGFDTLDGLEVPPFECPCRGCMRDAFAMLAAAAVLLSAGLLPAPQKFPD